MLFLKEKVFFKKKRANALFYYFQIKLKLIHQTQTAQLAQALAVTLFCSA